MSLLCAGATGTEEGHRPCICHEDLAQSRHAGERPGGNNAAGKCVRSAVSMMMMVSKRTKKNSNINGGINFKGTVF